MDEIFSRIIILLRDFLARRLSTLLLRRQEAKQLETAVGLKMSEDSTNITTITTVHTNSSYGYSNVFNHIKKYHGKGDTDLNSWLCTFERACTIAQKMIWLKDSYSCYV